MLRRYLFVIIFTALSVVTSAQEATKLPQKLVVAQNNSRSIASIFNTNNDTVTSTERLETHLSNFGFERLDATNTSSTLAESDKKREDPSAVRRNTTLKLSRESKMLTDEEIAALLEDIDGGQTIEVGRKEAQRVFSSKPALVNLQLYRVGRVVRRKQVIEAQTPQSVAAPVNPSVLEPAPPEAETNNTTEVEQFLEQNNANNVVRITTQIDQSVDVGSRRKSISLKTYRIKKGIVEQPTTDQSFDASLQRENLKDID